MEQREARVARRGAHLAHWSAGVVVAVVAVVGATPVGAPAADTSVRSTGAAIACSQAATRAVVTVSLDLDPACTYTGGFNITASNVVFDCHGARIRDASGTGAIGILVATPADVDLDNVTIRNCHVDGFLNSVHVRRDGFNHLAAGHEYDHHLQGVVVEDSTLTNSRGVGLYVDGYVTGTQIRRLVIVGAGSTGVYLDAGSRDNVVTENAIVLNGYRESGPNGTVAVFSGVTFRYWGPGREGIAIDGSRHNVVSGNWIAGNSAGGVFIYTNCGENVHSDPGSWVEHRYGADDNVITRNVIAGGETGVWVASRMGENVFPMDCSDLPYVSGPLQAITLDRAARNVVLANVFADSEYGVRVEDDGAVVTGNDFAGPDATHHAVIVGTPWRTRALGRPVTDTVVRGNRSTIVGNSNPYRWVDGVVGLDAGRNRALGRRSRVCEAPDLPRRSLIFVDALAVQDPNGPPVPKPEYTVPKLGALGPCS